MVRALQIVSAGSLVAMDVVRSRPISIHREDSPNRRASRNRRAGRPYCRSSEARYRVVTDDARRSLSNTSPALMFRNCRDSQGCVGSGRFSRAQVRRARSHVAAA